MAEGASASRLAILAGTGLCAAGVASLLAALWTRRRCTDNSCSAIWTQCGLTREEACRFGRQLVLSKFGVAGQKALLQGSVLIVGAGGLGCPAALYLCAAGVGRVGIADDDTVAISNLHRQVGHAAKDVGVNKAHSLRRACLAVNPTCDVVAHPLRLGDLASAAALAREYDVLLDCTDAPGSRYLLNDAAVKAGRPLVAPSAVGFSGQLSVYNLDSGPCLRCAFPNPPGLDASTPVASCAENGVLGPVPGVLGSLSAVEVIKVLAKGFLTERILTGRILLYDALDPTQPFRTMKVRKSAQCACCSSQSPAKDLALPATCAVPRRAHGVPAVTPAALQKSLTGTKDGDAEQLLIDVRAPPHFAVTSLRGSENWPLPELLRLASAEEVRQRLQQLAKASGKSQDYRKLSVVCICRRGNDSSLATEKLLAANVDAKNLEGGLQALLALEEDSSAKPVLT
eukprot:TRINITY_DN45438_c0_g1_i1.p1 TRINITY_DN45438_c0_g1~~TRINITY_DN45438_c0_g1_i1.p1  ORF type:complete len:456 (-),score=83.85 TRINITY_DN45438_c0_g1_i1:40-1407(-)